VNRTHNGVLDMRQILLDSTNDGIYGSGHSPLHRERASQKSGKTGLTGRLYNESM